MELNFDLASFLFGCVGGIVLASLLRLRALKELRLKLEAIGVDLGIEGFGDSSAASSQSIGDVSGHGNEINQAGRDINKTSNLYKTMQAAAAAAMGADKGHANGIFRIVTRFSHNTENQSLMSRLSQIQRGGDQWFERYCGTYMADPGFRDELASEIQRLVNQGWHVESVRPVDNLNNGLLFEITSTRALAT